MITRVIKRNGQLQPFNPEKIDRAILMAFNAVQPGNIPDIKPIRESVLNIVGNGRDVSIEEIQNAVEKVLMVTFPDVGKAYILYRDQRARERAARSQLKPDPNAIGNYIHPAKYARYLPELKRRETYLETSHRVRDMHIKRWPGFADEIQHYWRWVDEQKVLPSMRSMQFGGKAIEQHNARLYNCAFSHADRVRFFQEAFYLLLCGCGCGFSVQWHHVAKLPPIADKIDPRRVRHYTVADSIEGWAEAVGVVFDAAITGYHVELDYRLIRPEGAPLRTSGGVAPGHLPLRRLLERLREDLAQAAGRQLRPIEVFDCVCHIAEAVLAGGIRRSSLICLFSPDDGEMLYAKAPKNFNYSGLRSHRAMANISAVLLRATVTEDLFKRILVVNRRTHGEPGFYFTESLEYGCNPCGEIGQHPVLNLLDLNPDEQGIWKQWGTSGWSFCNLCEINCGKFTHYSDFIYAAQAASFIGTLQSAYTDFPYLGPVTEAIARRDTLLGVSLMGIHDTPEISLNPGVLQAAAAEVNATNRKWAPRIGVNVSARTTTVKPGGTAPKEVIPMVASGISYHHARRYFMRITANPLEPIAQHFKKHNPHMVDVKPNGDWSLVFCVEAPETAVTTKESNAHQLVDDIFTVYENWVKPGTLRPEVSPGLTHNVSSTVTFHPGEYDSTIQRIWDNKHRVAAMAFFPQFSDKGIPFVPREEVLPQDEGKWRHYLENYKPVDYTQCIEEQDLTARLQEAACVGGACDMSQVASLINEATGVVVLFPEDYMGVVWRIANESWTPLLDVTGLPLGAEVARHDAGWMWRYEVVAPPQRSGTGKWYVLARPVDAR